MIYSSRVRSLCSAQLWCGPGRKGAAPLHARATEDPNFKKDFENVHKYKKIKILVSAGSKKANQTSNPKWHYAQKLIGNLWNEMRR